MSLSTYLGVVAATNMKQRTRKLLEYYHAEHLNYTVVGTPNRLEYELGFFVRGGDGLADVKPIAHLYKTQVLELAWHLGVPEEITDRTPDTGTYSLPQTQAEFFFGAPIEHLDIILRAYNLEIPASSIATTLGLSGEHGHRVYRDIDAKRRVSQQLRAAPLVMHDSEASSAARDNGGS